MFEKPKISWLTRLKNSLSKTRENLSGLFLTRKIDAELLQELETQLLTADIGIEATTELMHDLHKRLSRNELNDSNALLAALKEKMVALLSPCEIPLQIDADKKPFILLMVGVNGSGKTTTIGKLTHRFLQENHSVILAAGDTFRAAAVEQLTAWGKRNHVPVIAQHDGADSASVTFDTIQAAKARHIQIVIADTAGRLHTQNNLMEELKKIKRVMQKLDPSAPHEVMLVLDASLGQNALNQAEQFHQAIGITGICMTKLDGTAKGGILFAIAAKLKLPIRFIGIGEEIDDLKPFVARDFIDALFNEIT